MAFSHTLHTTVTGAGTTIQDSQTFTAALHLAIDESIAITDDNLINLSIDVSEIQLIKILSDQDLTLETNSSTVPDETLNLLANSPYIWDTKSLFTNLLATDITKIYLSNGSGSVATFKLIVLYDPTP